MVVSGRLRARPKEVKDVAVSPSPWSRRRMFGDGDDDDGGGGVMVTVREGGKSDERGALVGMVWFSSRLLMGFLPSIDCLIG